ADGQLCDGVTAVAAGSVVRSSPVATLRTLTVAPATNAPEGSVTEPRIVPRNVWPTSTAVESRTNTINKCSFIYGPPLVVSRRGRRNRPTLREQKINSTFRIAELY